VEEFVGGEGGFFVAEVEVAVGEGAFAADGDEGEGGVAGDGGVAVRGTGEDLEDRVEGGGAMRSYWAGLERIGGISLRASCGFAEEGIPRG
jgi:hypothetical protein